MQPTDSPDLPRAVTQAGTTRRNTRWTRLVFFLLGVSLVISVLLNVWLYQTVLSFGPKGGQPGDAGPEVLPPPPPGTVRMVFAGDSDIELWEPLPDIKGIQIIQRGSGGDRTEDLFVRLESDVVELKPAVAVVTIGGNDLEDIGMLPDQEKTIVENCQRTIRAIVDHLRRRHIRVLVLTIFPFGTDEPGRPDKWSDATYAAAARVNTMLRTLAGPGVSVLDCDPILAEPDGRRKRIFSLNFEHVNYEGYRTLNLFLTPVLESLAKQPRP